MSIFKKVLLVTAILATGILCALIYWNQHLVFVAENENVTEQRITVLEKSDWFYPWNDLVFYGLGKAYYDLEVSGFGEKDPGDKHIQKSISHFKRSLRINPTSYFGHFYYARALHKMSFDDPSYEEIAYEEYIKAARLAGQNAEVLFEVGKVFLTKWMSLSEEDREFTIAILKEVVKGKDRERINSLFYFWEISGADFELLDSILPEDSQIYRDFAVFLGERNLYLKERQRYLTRAEFLEFVRAQDAFKAGDSALFYYRFKEAQNLFNRCLNYLKRIEFYQNLSDAPNQINPVEFEALQKRTLLNLIKSQLEQESELNGVGNILWEYLEIENNAAAIKEMESYLKKKGLLKQEADARINDLGQLSLQLYISLREGRFRENMAVGRNILRSFGVVPEGQELLFAKILEIVAESFQRVDFLYDSNDFYIRALEWDPGNLGTLVKLRSNYERLRAFNKIQEVDRRIQELVSPREVETKHVLNRGQMFRRDVVSEGKKINLGLRFKMEKNGRRPVISVFFNGRVVWEDYLEEDSISVEVEPSLGINVIQITPVNRAVELTKITFENL